MPGVEPGVSPPSCWKRCREAALLASMHRGTCCIPPANIFLRSSAEPSAWWPAIFYTCLSRAPSTESSAQPRSIGCSIMIGCSRTYMKCSFEEDGWRHNAVAARILRVFEREPAPWRQDRSLHRTSLASASPGSFRMQTALLQPWNALGLSMWKPPSNLRRQYWRMRRNIATSSAISFFTGIWKSCPPSNCVRSSLKR